MHYTRESDGENSSLEPIAIVGMGCRLPGAVDSASSLWNLLVERRSGQTSKVPGNRFNIDAHYHQNLERPGSFNVLGGYFLDGALEDFDPTFFNMTPIEAMWMDPQQRKMLEVSYECLENAGLTLDAVAGSNTAVFVGSFTSDYQQMSIRDTDFRHNYAATGVDPGIISNRIGNTFNLKGPSFTINTACSSSVYAIHNACHALRARDCEAAIAGGVNLILTVDQHMNTAKLGILSPTSTCHTFDATADGYGRAEGAGALYLKRLSDAIRDGDPIRGLIRSSAVNTNGKVESMGITHPSVKGQEAVMRAAYKRANLDPNITAYAECHGTGTPVGDPIEVKAISNAMNDTRSPEKPLLVGAIKANIGHSEAASGIFAVMKAAMMTESGIIPGVAGFKNLNPAIDEKTWNVKVNTDTIPWPKEFPIRRASVSSFGYGGTNGHVIVEAVESLYPWYEHGTTKADARYSNSASRPFLIGFCAHDKATLTRNIEAHGKIAGNFFLSDLAHTLNTRRNRFSQRAFTVAREGKEAIDFAVPAFTFGSAAKSAPKLGFLFTGQGANWVGMALEAMKAFPSFLDTIRALDDVLQKLNPAPSWSLEKILVEPSEQNRASQAEISQPICTAIQIAIVDLFARWDILPSVTVGHSSGEIAAAYSAGLFSAPEAMIAAFYRGLAVTQVAPTGTMLAVGVGIKVVFDYITDLSEVVVVACENSPSSVTLSGTSVGIQEVKRRLDEASIFARELRTGKAYHSPMMSSVAPVYTELLSRAYETLDEESFSWRYPRARMFSSVSGEEYLENHMPIQYWSNNLRGRVLFDSAVTTMGRADGLENMTCVIEIGPHSALAGPFKQICLANNFDRFKYIPTFVRGLDDGVQLLKTAGELFLRSYPLDIEEVNNVGHVSAERSIQKSRGPRLLVDLPPYQWNYEKRYWAEPRFSREQRHPKYARHDLLGSRIVGLSDHSIVWRNVLRHRDIPWLKDHSLGGSAVFPAAAHMSLAIEALRQVSEVEGVQFDGVMLRDINIKTALVIPDTDDGVEVQLRFQKATTLEKTPNWYYFMVESILDDRWTSHCEGRIAANHYSGQRKLESPVDATKLTQRIPGKRWYDAFKRVGFEYGPCFQPLSQIRTNGKDHNAAATVSIATESGLMNGESRYILHPSTIDACLQLIIVSINAGLHKEMPHGVVPVQMEEVSIWFPGEEETGSQGSAVAWTDEFDGRYFNTHTKLATEAGHVLLDVKNLRCVAYEAAVPQHGTKQREREPYMEVSWKPDISSLTVTQAMRVYPGIQSAEESIGAILELVNHKTSLRSVLSLGVLSPEMLKILKSSISSTTVLTVGDVSAKRLEEFQSIDENKLVPTLLLPPDVSEWSGAVIVPQDLVFIERRFIQDNIAANSLGQVKCFMAEKANLLISTDTGAGDELATQLFRTGFSNPTLRFDHPDTTVVLLDASRHENEVAHSNGEVTFVSLDSKAPQLWNLAKLLTERQCNVHVRDYWTLNISEARKVIIYDAEGNLLSTLSPGIFESLKAILCSGLPIIWMTAGVNDGKFTAGGMSQGFLRAIRSEQAAARITLLDVDLDQSNETISEVLLSKLESITTKNSGADTDFWLHNGIISISRLVPNQVLNEEFSAVNSSIEEVILADKTALGGRIVDGELVFRPSASDKREMLESEVEIQVGVTEFQRSDLQTNERRKTILGKVVAVGRGVDPALIGQNTVTHTNDAYSTTVRVNKSMCANFTNLDPIALAATLPNLCNAVNIAVRIGKAHDGERVLALPAPLPFIGTMIDLSRALGFELTVVVETEQEWEDCRLNYGVTLGSVLLVSDMEAIRGLLSKPTGEGPDLVIANGFSAFSQEIWRFMPPMSRFVLSDSAMKETPDALPFTRGVSFLSTGISSLYQQCPSTTGEILELTLSILSEHKDLLKKKPTVYDVAMLKDTNPVTEDLAQHDNAVLTYQYGESSVKVQSPSNGISFSPHGVYLLVGCLGGLGRSLTTWMMENGCKNFAFVSRSGTDKPEAERVIELLKGNGASVQVYRADASNDAEMVKIVSELSKTRSIRGVVHAAMVLRDGIFETMAYESFAATVNPKMNGAISLHKALGDTPLDFFVMTSSISAVLGNPGQTNYSAGNSFLDSLAWHRNLNGLAGSSLALPMVLDVGVVAENEKIEVSLSRKGMYGIDEREMLRGFETAMMRSVPTPNKPTSIGNAQIVLGVEPAYLATALASDDTVDVYWYNDARFSGIRAAVEDIQASSTASGGISGDFASSLKAARAESPEAVLQAIASHIMKRCSSILMIPLESFEYDGTSIAAYGLDSMIGAELRNWLFKEFGLDMGFQTLLAPTLTFKGLSATVAETLKAVKG